MSKNSKIIIAVAVAIIIILALFGFSRRGERTDSGPTESVSTSDVNLESATGQRTLKSLLGSVTPVQCTFSDGASEGTVSAVSGMLRGDFSTNVNGRPTIGHMIFDGEMAHMWMDGEAKGFSIAFNPKDKNPIFDEKAGGLDPDKSVDYSCHPWTQDSSVFTPPTDIQFQNMEEMMHMMQNQGDK